MSAPENLEDCYTDELADLWSANDQMEKVVKELASVAGDEKLKKRLEKSTEGIAKHTETIKALLSEMGEDEPEHCKGMEGLCKEALKHAVEEDIDDGAVRDVIIIAQYQRMCHYGIAGFGTAKAYAEALGEEEAAETLEQITADIYDTDENMSQLAEMCVNLRAADEEGDEED